MTIATPVSTRPEPEPAGKTVVVIDGRTGTGLETTRRVRTERADVIFTGQNGQRVGSLVRVDSDQASDTALEPIRSAEP
jgi:short-subunit dehydrogenase involved in D-alanine esterification of teichoic acids